MPESTQILPSQFTVATFLQLLANRLPLATAGLFAFTLTSGSAEAQNTIAATKPASKATVNSLILASTVNSCALAIDEKFPVQKAMTSATQGVVFALTRLNGGDIEGAGKGTPDQIGDMIFINIVRGVKGNCYQKLATPDKEFIDKVSAEIEKMTKQQAPGPQQK